MNSIQLMSFLLATIQGRVEVTVWPDNGNDFYSIDFRDDGATLVGEGSGVFAQGAQANDRIYLERSPSGTLKGFVFGTPFDLTCTESQCTDSGSTDVNIAIKKESDGMHYDGTLNFQFIHAVVSNDKISVTSDGSFEATGAGNGEFSGEGAFDWVEPEPSFQVQILSDGSLMNLEDPAVFIVSVLQSFTRNLE
jgi:hypothetical protein